MYFTYILYSELIERYYVGYTSDINGRLVRHGMDKSKFTGQVDDWKLIRVFEFESKTDAIKLENKIKRRGISRFLKDLEKSI